MDDQHDVIARAWAEQWLFGIRLVRKRLGKPDIDTDFAAEIVEAYAQGFAQGRNGG